MVGPLDFSSNFPVFFSSVFLFLFLFSYFLNLGIYIHIVVWPDFLNLPSYAYLNGCTSYEHSLIYLTSVL